MRRHSRGVEGDCRRSSLGHFANVRLFKSASVLHSKFHGSLCSPPDPVPLQTNPSTSPPVHVAAIQPAVRPAPVQEPVKPVTLASTHPLAAPPPTTPSPLPSNGMTTPPSLRNSGPQTRPVLQSQTSQQHECILCDAIVDICLKPCGHSVLCRECASRAKKCPTCRVSDTH